ASVRGRRGLRDRQRADRVRERQDDRCATGPRPLRTVDEARNRRALARFRVPCSAPSLVLGAASLVRPSSAVRLRGRATTDCGRTQDRGPWTKDGHYTDVEIAVEVAAVVLLPVFFLGDVGVFPLGDLPSARILRGSLSQCRGVDGEGRQ